MAELGRRDEVQDPLALNPRERGADRSLQTYGIRNPGMGAGDAATDQAMKSLNVLTGVQAAVARVYEAKKDEFQTEGELANLQGKTEQEMAATGNKYTMRGWQTMNAANRGNDFFLTQAQYLDTEGMKMDPDSYRTYLMEQQREALKNLPDDPVARKMFVASFKDTAPKLVVAQAEKHNEWNRNNQLNEFGTALDGTPDVSLDTSVPVLDGSFRVSETEVAEPIDYNDNDADIAVRTMLAEAGGEGYEGMAAVAHVIINRAKDGRWPKSIQDVALQDQQFSAWNKGAGGNNPLKYDPNSPAYQNAMKVFKAVAGGIHVDPTQGATYYYSPKGMDKLVQDGDQNNHVPSWLAQAAAERGGATLRLGNHIFAGRTRNGQKVEAGDGAVIRAGVTADEATPEQVAQAAGVPEDDQPARGNRLQRLIQNSPLKREDKATVLADRIRRGLEAGDDTLYNDAGGIAMLQGLNAKPSEIDEVMRAREQFEAKQEKKFDQSYEEARSTLLMNVTAGKFQTIEEAQAAVVQLSEQHKGTPAEAKAMWRRVTDDWIKANDDDVVPVKLRSTVEKLYEGVSSGRLTPEEAGEQAIAASKELGVKDSVTNNFVERMFNADRQRKQEIKTQTETAFKKQEKEKVVVDRVTAALAGDRGLKGIEGNVTIPDDTRPGQTKEVNAEQYGIYAVKKEVADSFAARAAQEGKKPSDYGPEITKKIYEKLAKTDTYDVEFGRAMAGAVSGNILGKNNEVNEDALAAFDMYMQLANNPNVGSDYLRGMIPDEQARTLFETAQLMYDSRGNIGTALSKAKQLLNDPLTPERRLEKNGAFNAQAVPAISNAVQVMAGREGFWGRLGIGAEVPAESMRAAKSGVNEERMRAYLFQRAEGYHLQNPNEPVEVSIKKAQQQLALDGVIVGQDVVLGNYERGERLDQVMGIEGMGRGAPNKALENWLSQHGADPEVFGSFWTDRFKSTASEGTAGGLARYNFAQPNYGVTYDPSQGTLEVILYKDDKRTETVGNPVYLNAADLGKRYKQDMIKEGPSTFDKGYRKFLEGAATALEPTPDPAAAGERMGQYQMPTVKIEKSGRKPN